MTLTYIGLSCKTEDITITLKRVLMRRTLHNKDINLIIRSDNGSQFIIHKFQETCRELHLEHERIPFKTPNKNAHIESFHRLLEDECCLSRYEFKSYTEDYKVVSEYIKFYNDTRIHGSIGYISPKEYYQKVMNGTHQKQVVNL